MLTRKVLGSLFAPCLLVVSACQANDSGGAASTVATVTATATATVTVTQVPSPYVSPTPTKSTGHVGMIWASLVDPARVNQPINSEPTFDGGDGIVIRVEQAIYSDASMSGPLGEECAAEIERDGQSGDTHCLYLQWSFDVPADYPTDEARLSPEELLNPDGRQIGNYTTTGGVPGAKNVGMNAIYVGGVPGSTAWWSSGSNERGWKKGKLELPGADSFLPLSFD